MLHKCVCGKYTDWGSLCVQCSMTASTGEPDIKLDVEDYIEGEEEEDS